MILKLTIELVPETVWFSSVYKYLETCSQLDKWHEIKEKLFEKEGKKCWICGNENLRLEAHEFWEYDDKNHIQKLIAIHHLCSLCHKVKHIGLWLHTLKGQENLVREGLKDIDIINHFCKVNNCSKKDFEEYEKNAFVIWKERSKHKWKQDFGIFNFLIGDK